MACSVNECSEKLNNAQFKNINKVKDVEEMKERRKERKLSFVDVGGGVMPRSLATLPRRCAGPEPETDKRHALPSTHHMTGYEVLRVAKEDHHVIITRLILKNVSLR